MEEQLLPSPAQDVAGSGSPAPDPPRLNTIVSIITAFAVAITGFFGLFGGLLAHLAPCQDANFGSDFSVQSAELFTTILSLVLYILVLTKDDGSKRKRNEKGLISAGVITAICGLALYFVYIGLTWWLVFSYPPSPNPGVQTQQLVAGLWRKPKYIHDPRANADLLVDWGLKKRMHVWSDRSVLGSRCLLVGTYFALTFSISAALFLLAEVIRRSALSNTANIPPNNK